MRDIWKSKTNDGESKTSVSKLQITECCSRPGIPLELLRTRIWSTEIKVRKNKESQSDKQSSRKKSQTNTGSLWSDQDKNQLFILISRLFHQNKDELAVLLTRAGHLEPKYFLKVEEISFFNTFMFSVKPDLSRFPSQGLF